jgi:regulator of protease activity HflC (stomatin/prohibitin superfamily)
MQDNKRGGLIALLGLLITLALNGIAWFLLARRTPGALSLVALSAVPILLWLMTAVIFYCRYLRDREKAELEELAERGGEGIFEGGQEHRARGAARRVELLEKWGIPAFTLILAILHVLAGLAWLVSILPRFAATEMLGDAPPLFFAAFGGTIIALLLSRYCLGMAWLPVWRPLRAPASYLFLNAVLFLVTAVSVVVARYFGSVGFGRVIEYVMAAALVLLGAEYVLNFLLDLFRPRMPGVESRFSYDSRLLNLLASPESIGRSIAEALNYQFGFEVSSTWFYRLLEKTFIPLLLTGLLVLWLMTGVVVVDEGVEYLVLRLGEPVKVLKPGQVVHLDPDGEIESTESHWSGLHLIWPWPISRADKFETGRIKEIRLGVGSERRWDPVRYAGGERYLYLWTEEHGPQVELDTLVAVPPRTSLGPAAADAPEGVAELPSVSIIKLVASVYYQVENVYRYSYRVAEAEQMLRVAAYREMVRYAASATLDEVQPEAAAQGRPQAIMTEGRGDAATALRQRIAAVAKEMDLGVKVLRVELWGVHPPVDAAPAFEEVLAAERERDGIRYAAQTEANKIRADVAGDTDVALKLAQTLSFLDSLENILNRRRDGAELFKGIDGALESARNRLEDIEKAIERERLLGQIGPETATVSQQLRDRQQDFVFLLEKVRPSPRRWLRADKPGEPSPLEARRAEYRRQAEEYFARAEGQAAVRIAKARADSWTTEFERRAMAESFSVELQALRAAPRLHSLDRRLQALAEVLDGKKKVVVGVDPERVELRFNAERAPRGIQEAPITGDKD